MSMKVLFTVFMLLTSLLLSAKEPDSLNSKANSLLEIWRTNGTDYKLNKSESEIITTLYSKIHGDTVAEIQEEAKSNNMDKDSYIKNSLSFTSFVEDLERKLEKVDEMEDSELFILLLKSEVRFKIQKSVRFIPDGFFENEKRARDCFIVIINELGFAVPMS